MSMILRFASRLMIRRLQIHRRSISSTASPSIKVDLDNGTVSVDGKPLYQTVIGMEIHAQLDIPTKLFSSAEHSNKSNRPNSQVHPLDVAVPGFLPTLSQAAVHQAVLAAAACNCSEIPQISRFERKHYFYADLPQGYQISQQRWPLARNGFLNIATKCSQASGKSKKKPDAETISIGIDRIQLEQDTGKTIQVSGGDNTISSFVDFNRAGCALVEIVFAPDLRSARDASSAMTKLRDLLKHVGVCDGRMDLGSLRCDLNVSVAPLLEAAAGDNENIAVTDNPFAASLPPGTGHRVEVKNLNSMRQVVLAAEYEAKRQVSVILEENTPIQQETRTFDVKNSKTVLIRTKGDAVDYRFMPEPDIPPLVLDEEVFDGLTLQEFLENNMPERPEVAKARLIQEYHLSTDIATIITNDPFAISLFEEAVQTARAILGDDDDDKKKLPKDIANWLCNDLLGLTKEAAADEEASAERHFAVSAQQLGELVALIHQGIVSTKLAKKILSVMYNNSDLGVGKSPRQISDERGWKVITELESLIDICRKVLEANPKQLNEYKEGGRNVHKVQKVFVGKAMALSKGTAHPERLQEALKEVLDETAPGVQG